MNVADILRNSNVLFVESTLAIVKIPRCDKESLAKAVMYYGSRNEDITVTNYIGEVALKSCGTIVRTFNDDVAGVSRDEFLKTLVPMQFHNTVPQKLDSFCLSDVEDVLDDCVII